MYDRPRRDPDAERPTVHREAAAVLLGDGVVVPHRRRARAAAAARAVSGLAGLLTLAVVFAWVWRALCVEAAAVATVLLATSVAFVTSAHWVRIDARAPPLLRDRDLVGVGADRPQRRARVSGAVLCRPGPRAVDEGPDRAGPLSPRGS